jgi:hypothetical protein
MFAKRSIPVQPGKPEREKGVAQKQTPAELAGVFTSIVMSFQYPP